MDFTGGIGLEKVSREVMMKKIKKTKGNQKGNAIHFCSNMPAVKSRVIFTKGNLRCIYSSLDI